MRKKGPLILKFIFTDGMQMDIKQAYEHDLWMLFFLLRKHSFSNYENESDIMSMSEFQVFNNFCLCVSINFQRLEFF